MYHFFPHIQKDLRPIHKLSRQKRQFKWTKEHQKSFDTIRNLMCNPRVLYLPKREGRFTLYSDTSRVATGSYLTQTINGKEYLLGYYSKKFLLQKREPPTSRLRNLSFKLSQFTFKIGYKKGSDLALADYLSRTPQNGDSEIDRILPLAFSAVSDFLQNDSDDNALPVLTRAKAKALGVKVPDLFLGRKTFQSPAGRNQNVQAPAQKSDATPRQSVSSPAPYQVPVPLQMIPSQCSHYLCHHPHLATPSHDAKSKCYSTASSKRATSSRFTRRAPQGPS
ncbi:hypothetical protein HOLleu_26770 [Holothuria leucospilota]|uniref:Reverse transcriptase/retrotransposon-derived protein RNase H-like domain-containing protein n=1 Tax=Holothuria leucospilota TaxID=206669 RepID=A0A9Q1BPN0_HOLLE|nr:hypothetical protein HOLleu_26770 [Holothuria leucospilota]